MAIKLKRKKPYFYRIRVSVGVIRTFFAIDKARRNNSHCVTLCGGNYAINQGISNYYSAKGFHVYAILRTHYIKWGVSE